MRSDAEIIRAVDDARALRHPQRAMRVLLECGHLRLMPWNVTATGIGSQTACGICPAPEGEPHMVRLVVDIAETGVLHESWSNGPKGERGVEARP